MGESGSHGTIRIPRLVRAYAPRHPRTRREWNIVTPKNEKPEKKGQSRKRHGRSDGKDRKEKAADTSELTRKPA
jgi:hypothetical protein